MAQLTCENLVLGYEGRAVVRDLNFEVNSGDYLCIVGENGSGKSTLMRGLLGLKEPSSGTISFGDGLKPNEIGYLPQQTDMQRDFPAGVFEVVLSGRLNSLGRRFFYSKADRAEAERNLERMGMLDFKKRCYQELSGGQQQRVLLARALCATSRPSASASCRENDANCKRASSCAHCAASALKSILSVIAAFLLCLIHRINRPCGPGLIISHQMSGWLSFYLDFFQRS